MFVCVHDTKVHDQYRCTYVYPHPCMYIRMSLLSTCTFFLYFLEHTFICTCKDIILNVYIYIYMYVIICTYLFISVNLNIYSIFVYLYVYIYIYIYIYIHNDTNTHMHIDVHACMCVCVCVYATQALLFLCSLLHLGAYIHTYI